MSFIDRIKRNRLLVYNVRILLGNSYWLIVTPIAAAEIVFFWNTATAGFSSAAGIARTMEMLAPILGAFLCAYAVAPEQAGAGELVFVRPVSPEKILLLRLAAIFGFVLALFLFLLLVPLFALYRGGLSELPLLPSLLAALISMVFLSALSLAIASATRQPLLGLAVAGGYWALDLLIGSGFNPLLTMHSFADFVAARPMSELWWVNKLLLFGMAAAFYGWNRTLLGRPAAPRRVLVVARNTALIALVVFGYLWSGAAYKVAYGLRHEAELGNRTQLWYQQQFSPYGPLPVAWLFGRAFPLYVQAQQGRTAAGAASRGLVAPVDLTLMRRVVKEYPSSIWADNAQYELARATGRRVAVQPWTIYVYREGASQPAITVVDTDQPGLVREMQELVKRYPKSVFAPLALAHIASTQLALLDFTGAIASYERVLDSYPRAPQAAEAGLALHELYVREGRLEDALRAGDIAAAAALWDLRASAYFAAAQTAAQLGKAAEAKERYQKARAAAGVMRRQAGSRIKTGGTSMSPAEIILTAERIMVESDRALTGKATPASLNAAAAAPASASVRIMRQGRGLRGVRVALCEEPDRNGQASPFTTGAAATATTGEDGTAELAPLRAGSYRVIAFGLPGETQRWEVGGVHVPIELAGAHVALPAFALEPRRLPPQPGVRPSPPSGAGSAPRAGGGGRNGGARSTRPGGGGGARSLAGRGGGGRPGGNGGTRLDRRGPSRRGAREASY
jgi:tetratricopeptide (TPR) repeat protein